MKKNIMHIVEKDDKLLSRGGVCVCFFAREDVHHGEKSCLCGDLLAV